MEKIQFKGFIISEDGNLIENNQKILCNVLLNDGVTQAAMEMDKETLIKSNILRPLIIETSTSSGNASNIEWTTEETDFLLSKYDTYIKLIGPSGRFSSKKKMWMQVSEDLYNTLNVERTAVQCQNRYKTIQRRKSNNKKDDDSSDNAKKNVKFEEFFVDDDTIEPDASMSPDRCIISKMKRKKSSEDEADSPPKKSKLEKLGEILLQIHREKEEARERRHQEKLELIKTLFKK